MKLPSVIFIKVWLWILSFLPYKYLETEEKKEDNLELCKYLYNTADNISQTNNAADNISQTNNGVILYLLMVIKHGLIGSQFSLSFF